MEERKGRGRAENPDDSTDSPDNAPSRRRQSASGGAPVRSLEGSRLRLEYLRVLIWPAVVLSFLIVFSDELRDMSKRLSKIGAGGINAEFSTAQAGPKAVSSKAPDVWFAIIKISLEPEVCMSRAQRALERSGFKNITRVVVTYGYTDRFVGAVWCGEPDEVLITVAGPVQDLAAKHSQLAQAFASAGR